MSTYNLYFEISPPLIKRIGRKYVAMYELNSQNALSVPFKILYASNRIWREDSEGIYFVKHRTSNSTSVDLKEFLFVKLSCEEL
jgi:hypothetical protein